MRKFEDQVPFVVRLDTDDRQALFHRGDPLTFPARQVLLREHEPSSHVLIILSGWAKVTSAAPNGYEALLALRGPGDIVGEQALLSGRPRGATVTALDRIEALAIDADRFGSLLDERPDVARKLLALTADRTRDSDRRRVQFAALTVQERLALLLLELIHTHGEESEDGVQLTAGLTQSELAGSVGASREAVARLLKQLRERGIVRTGRRGIIVVRPDVLRQMTRSGNG
ncbi:Crp/Fnr family transcriptional regulator [Streptomyces griseoloalbus]|uniref:CRP-like cAMP-binding protein n=1 Tax=Streptomyces griseoloalbus TaxID=67303 RepID=A0A7W8BLR1_9ACTN|nr:Crp/Fnr family transcriptional regulator [Streptomyces albaduncus]MBB5125610.1 CRP-like cAMP-binding protein [Streptomyces albaduncus]GGV79652.1 catabolite gene activator [Streptomyces griseoloalbus]GGW56537.1 catabolite gene activator [Streptomyces albaduncus]